MTSCEFGSEQCVSQDEKSQNVETDNVVDTDGVTVSDCEYDCYCSDSGTDTETDTVTESESESESDYDCDGGCKYECSFSDGEEVKDGDGDDGVGDGEEVKDGDGDGGVGDGGVGDVVFDLFSICDEEEPNVGNYDDRALFGIVTSFFILHFMFGPVTAVHVVPVMFFTIVADAANDVVSDPLYISWFILFSVFALSTLFNLESFLILGWSGICNVSTSLASTTITTLGNMVTHNVTHNVTTSM